MKGYCHRSHTKLEIEKTVNNLAQGKFLLNVYYITIYII